MALAPTHDISVRDATVHLWADIDRVALSRARLDPNDENLDAARAILRTAPSAVLFEAFLARPLSRRGRHAEALAARDDALALTPGWDPWQSALVLRGAASSLLALGRPVEATAAAREALRHAPLDPLALLTLAEASATVDVALSLGVRAFLRDAGFGAPFVTGAPLPGEREATPWSPALRGEDVASMSEEDLARSLVLREVDAGFCARRASEVRHVQALVRRGDLGSARCVASYTRSGDSAMWTLVEGWLGVGVPDEVTWTTLRVLRDALDATPEGALAQKQTRGKAPNRYSSLVAYSYDKRFRELGSQDDVATLLYHADRGTRMDATTLAPSHPLVARFLALRAEVTDVFPPALPGQLLLGTTGPLLAGAPVEYPMHLEEAPRGVFPDRFVIVADRKSRCAACKATLEPGTPALESGEMKHDGEAHWKRLHPACATTPSRRRQLLRAVERERRALPGVAP